MLIVLLLPVVVPIITRSYPLSAPQHILTVTLRADDFLPKRSKIDNFEICKFAVYSSDSL